MKRLFRIFKERFGSIGSLILMVYTTLVVAAQAVVSPRFSPGYLVAVCLLALLLTAVPGSLLLHFLSGRNACPRVRESKLAALWRIVTGSRFYLIPLLVCMIYFVACYPGGWSDDSFNQYNQAIQNRYNDWHPVLHTLLAFKLPLTLTGGWPGSVVLLQILCFCGVIGYTCQTIRKYFGRWYAIIAMAWILMNPLVLMTAMHPWKDVGFAVCTLLMGTYALNTVATKGQWLRKPVNMVCFGVVAVLAAIFRHNGILFVIPVVLGLALFLSWKRALALCLGIVLLFVGIKGPVYMLLDVEKPDQRQVETLGLPMTVIGAVAAMDPDALDEETEEFVYRVAPREVWEEEYILGSYNSVKFHGETDNDVIEEYGRVKVISMMLRCFRSSPRVAFRSLIELTKLLYALDDASCGFVFPRVVGKHDVIKQVPNMTLIKVCKSYALFVANRFSRIFMYVGVQHFILLVFVLAKLSLKKRQDWRKLLVILGVFCYNYGSGLLLSTAGDVYRLFFYTFPLMPVMLLILCCNHEERSRPLFVWRKK
jgi:hypothetical protein